MILYVAYSKMRFSVVIFYHFRVFIFKVVADLLEGSSFQFAEIEFKYVLVLCKIFQCFPKS